MRIIRAPNDDTYFNRSIHLPSPLTCVPRTQCFFSTWRRGRKHLGLCSTWKHQHLHPCRSKITRGLQLHSKATSHTHSLLSAWRKRMLTAVAPGTRLILCLSQKLSSWENGNKDPSKTHSWWFAKVTPKGALKPKTLLGIIFLFLWFKRNNV